VKAPVPPVAFARANPSGGVVPLQTKLVGVTVNVIAEGSVMTTLVIESLQPLISEIVTVYVPAINVVAVAVACASLQINV
jgi:hypothetical protein